MWSGCGPQRSAAHTRGSRRPRRSPPTALVSAALDTACVYLADGEVAGLDACVAALDAARRRMSPAEWRACIARQVAPHPAVAMLREEPFTRRAYEKPRGYAGDAPMLDLVYNDATCADAPAAVAASGALGARLHAWAVHQPACRSVVARRDLLARRIDQVAEGCGAARVLSLACGHLREAQRSIAVRTGAVAEFVAIDQDAASLAVVAREQGHLGVRPVRASVGRVLAAPDAFGTFDLAYAAGLYDYLDARVARALTAALFATLRPGGMLLVANFAPELRDIGYMEAVMEWHLVYRDERTMLDLSADVPACEIADQRLYRDEPGNVVHLELRRV